MRRSDGACLLQMRLDLVTQRFEALLQRLTGRVELQVVQDNPGYRFTSDRAQRAGRKYGAHSVSLLAVKPVSASLNTTTTQEVSK